MSSWSWKSDLFTNKCLPFFLPLVQNRQKGVISRFTSHMFQHDGHSTYIIWNKPNGPRKREEWQKPHVHSNFLSYDTTTEAPGDSSFYFPSVIVSSRSCFLFSFYCWQILCFVGCIPTPSTKMSSFRTLKHQIALYDFGCYICNWYNCSKFFF